jgi:GT2 family glycosyltransferase
VGVSLPSSTRVIITAYNNLPLLRMALRGYLRQTTQDFTLVIADDGSTPEIKNWLDSFARETSAQGIELEHVWHEDLGFRRSMILNEAVRQASDESLLIFSDGDCIPPADFVEKHNRAHVPESFHVGGAYRLDQAISEELTEKDIDSGAFESLGSEVHRKDLSRRRFKSRWGTFLRLKNRPKVLGLNMAMDRDLFEDVNGFDEKFVGYGLEDSDLRDRVMRRSPRPRVVNFYGDNDVYHLWHPVNNTVERRQLPTWGYYQQRRPVRCETGLSR